MSLRLVAMTDEQFRSWSSGPLNVFEANAAALAMYRALGYSVVSSFMEKVLSPDSP